MVIHVTYGWQVDLRTMTSTLSAAVYGEGEDIVLIPLPAGEESRLALEYAAEHAMPFCGVMTFTDGKPSARCEPNAAAVSTMMSAAPHFAQYVAGKIRRVDRWNELT
jgi:hypothetical protein